MDADRAGRPVKRYWTRSLGRAPGRRMRSITPCRKPYCRSSDASRGFITPALASWRRLSAVGACVNSRSAFLPYHDLSRCCYSSSSMSYEAGRAGHTVGECNLHARDPSQSPSSASPRTSPSRSTSLSHVSRCWLLSLSSRSGSVWSLALPSILRSPGKVTRR